MCIFLPSPASQCIRQGRPTKPIQFLVRIVQKQDRQTVVRVQEVRGKRLALVCRAAWRDDECTV